MSFQVVRHEHPDIFVLSRQTYEFSEEFERVAFENELSAE